MAIMHGRISASELDPGTAAAETRPLRWMLRPAVRQRSTLQVFVMYVHARACNSGHC